MGTALALIPMRIISGHHARFDDESKANGTLAAPSNGLLSWLRVALL
jgi:hypothetical protein